MMARFSLMSVWVHVVGLLSCSRCSCWLRACARLCFLLMASHVGVAVLACALAVLLPCRNSAGARSARRLLSVVSCAIVSHVIPPVFVFRVFLASASLLSCGIVCRWKTRYGKRRNSGGL